MIKLLVLMAIAGLGVSAAGASGGAPARQGVAVVAVPGRGDLAAAERAARREARAAGAAVAVRRPVTFADQLGALHLLAASGRRTIVTAGVDRSRALDPVRTRYPDVRFVVLGRRRVGHQRR